MNSRARPLTIVGIVIAAIAALAYCKQASLVPLQLEYERHLRIVADVRAIGCQLDRYKESVGAYPSTLSAIEDCPQRSLGPRLHLSRPRHP
jgi:hypothetical protein